VVSTVVLNDVHFGFHSMGLLSFALPFFSSTCFLNILG